MKAPSEGLWKAIPLIGREFDSPWNCRPSVSFGALEGPLTEFYVCELNSKETTAGRIFCGKVGSPPFYNTTPLWASCSLHTCSWSFALLRNVNHSICLHSLIGRQATPLTPPPSLRSTSCARNNFTSQIPGGKRYIQQGHFSRWSTPLLQIYSEPISIPPYRAEPSWQGNSLNGIRSIAGMLSRSKKFTNIQGGSGILPDKVFFLRRQPYVLVHAHMLHTARSCWQPGRTDRA